jgi:ribosomal protein L4
VAAKRNRAGACRLKVVRHLAWRRWCRFGPKPRDYTKKISKTVRRLAFQKALSERIKAGDVLTVDSFSVKEPKTKAFVSLVKGHTDAKKVLLISDAFDENFYRSARNVKPVLLVTARTSIPSNYWLSTRSL